MRLVFFESQVQYFAGLVEAVEVDVANLPVLPGVRLEQGVSRAFDPSFNADGREQLLAEGGFAAAKIANQVQADAARLGFQALGEALAEIVQVAQAEIVGGFCAGVVCAGAAQTTTS